MVIAILESIFSHIGNVRPAMLEKVACQYAGARAAELISADRYVKANEEYNDNLYKLIWANTVRSM